jgi:hypothetical protein
MRFLGFFDIVLDISLINKIDEYSVVSEIENLQKVYLEVLIKFANANLA